MIDRDEVLAMADDSGLASEWQIKKGYVEEANLIEFARLLERHVIDRCVEVCCDLGRLFNPRWETEAADAIDRCAAAIRALNDQTTNNPKGNDDEQA